MRSVTIPSREAKFKKRAFFAFTCFGKIANLQKNHLKLLFYAEALHPSPAYCTGAFFMIKYEQMRRRLLWNLEKSRRPL